MTRKKTKRGTSPVDVVIGNNIRSLRSQRNMSQSTLGERLGITFQQIQKYEKATNRVAASTLLQMARILGVTVDSFYQGVENLPEGSADAPATPVLSSRAYRLAVLFDSNENVAFKKAVSALLATVDGGNPDEDEETVTED